MTDRWTFEGIELKKSPGGDGLLSKRNPVRGFYHVYTYDLCRQEPEEDWVWALQRQETLALVILDLGGAKARALTDDELYKAERICALFSGNGMQMILRPLYDRQGQGQLREPETLELVKTHMRQLLPVLGAFSDHILTVQGLLIGSWGEMHSSRYTDTASLLGLYETMRSCLGEISLSVRKPQFQRLFADESGGICTGLYDDAILGSDTDMGTYGWIPERKPQIMWTPELELDFIRRETTHVLCGGELLAAAREHTRQEILARMRLMRLTYLNAVHEPAVWEYLGKLYAEDSAVSCRDEIERLLGYCYVIRQAALQRDAGVPVLEVVMANEGFACCYDMLRLELSVGAHTKSLRLDGKTLQGGEQLSVRFPIEDVLKDISDAVAESSLPVRLFIYHEKTGLPIFFDHDYSESEDDFLYARYARSSSSLEGMLLGVLFTVKSAT